MEKKRPATMEDKAKVFIIDDEEIIRESCVEILADSNYEVATAQNGEIGLSMLDEFKPDLVFVDLKMPGISGFEVLESIQQYDPTIVTIVITGFATVSSAVDAMKMGAFDFLPKPFTPDEMRLITRRGLEKRNLVLETIALRREREMMREHFAAIVSHELKSPLSAVQQNLIALTADLSEQLSDEQKGRLERSKARLSDLMKLIHTWLRVMSTDIDNIRTQFEVNSVDAMIAKAVESVEPHAIRKAIDIVPSVEQSLSPVMGDEGTLVEALVNIIGNAVKYSHLGSQINVKAQEKDGEISISISDSGVGIPEEDLQYIFDDFYIASSAPKDARGSGLGLAITRRIIEAHDGSISVESQLGKGSTFVIHLPVYQEPNTQ
jgi:signal transduction histidine kinase